MIFYQNNSIKTQIKIEKIIGKPLTLIEKLRTRSLGSNLYNLRSIHIKNDLIKDIPRENSRCNFEIHNSGILLRINDNQKLYCLPLHVDLITKMMIEQDDLKVYPFGFSSLLISLGLDIETIKKHRLLSGGLYRSRMKLHIETDSESIILDSHWKNYKSELKFFLKTHLKDKLIV